MYYYKIIKTLASKSGILILNFIIVLCTTHFWGAEGRGIISLLIANLSIIVTVNNVFSGSSVAYHASKYPSSELIKPAIPWIFFITLLFVFVLLIFQNNLHPLFLLSLTLLTSLTNFNQSVFIGNEKISLFNIYSFLVPLFTLICTVTLYYTGVNTSITAFFWSYGIAYLFVWIISLKNIEWSVNFTFNYDLIKRVFTYGYKNELSYFLQFLNYRLSYFVILRYLGFKDLGVFSIGIALAESLWIISSSISTVHFSKVVNSDDRPKMIRLSTKSALISLFATLIFGMILVLIPASWFGIIFGKDFAPVKQLFLLLLPGILIQSFSSVYGHFLSATGQMRPLVIKSILGLIATILFTLLLIPKFGLKGACISTIISYFISSGYICYAFYKGAKTNNSVTNLSI
jgi:O-antigen/teichoic acid export membrane protein